MAHFHFNMKTDNKQSNKGVFFNKVMSESYIDRVVWALKGYLIKIHSPSYINKPRGGKAIFGELVISEYANGAGWKSLSQTPHVADQHIGGWKHKQSSENINRQTGEQDSYNTIDADVRGQLHEADEEIHNLENTAWYQKMLAPQHSLILIKKSKHYNALEKYWQFCLIVEALK